MESSFNNCLLDDDDDDDDDDDKPARRCGMVIGTKATAGANKRPQ